MAQLNGCLNLTSCTRSTKCECVLQERRMLAFWSNRNRQTLGPPIARIARLSTYSRDALPCYGHRGICWACKKENTARTHLARARDNPSKTSSSPSSLHVEHNSSDRSRSLTLFREESPLHTELAPPVELAVLATSLSVLAAASRSSCRVGFHIEWPNAEQNVAPHDKAAFEASRCV